MIDELIQWVHGGMMIEFSYSPAYALNEKRYGQNDSTHCVICCKPIKDLDKHKLWVRIVNGGGFIGTDAEGEAEPEADLGYYPIGRDCLRQRPELKEYVSSSTGYVPSG